MVFLFPSLSTLNTQYATYAPRGIDGHYTLVAADAQR